MAWEIRQTMTCEELLEWLAFFEIKGKREKELYKNMKNKQSSINTPYNNRLKSH